MVTEWVRFTIDDKHSRYYIGTAETAPFSNTDYRKNGGNLAPGDERNKERLLGAPVSCSAHRPKQPQSSQPGRFLVLDDLSMNMFAFRRKRQKRVGAGSVKLNVS